MEIVDASENPWTGDIIWEKTSTSSSKPLN
jgi:hypothetical protein